MAESNVKSGCCNEKNDDMNISIHMFPSDPKLRSIWEKNVQNTRINWTATKWSNICSAHFTEDCFDRTPIYMSEMGIQMTRKRILKPDAVPTIFHQSNSSRDSQDVTVPTKFQRAYDKREKARVMQVILAPESTMQQENEDFESAAASDSNVSSNQTEMLRIHNYSVNVKPVPRPDLRKGHHVRGIRCVLCDSPVVKNIKLYPFPTRPYLRKAWLQFAKQYNDEVNPRSSQICSQHFDEGSWTLVHKKIGEFGIGTSYVLNPEAVPTIIMLPSVSSTKSILESKNSLLSMIMAPKLEPPKNTPTKDFSKKALHASIESVEKIFDECTVCGASKRGRVILHKLPDTILLKMKWLDFIEQATKKRLQIPMGRARVCSQHFDDACYDHEQSVMNNTGYGVKTKKIMKKNAVPSIFWLVKNGVQQVMIVKDDEGQDEEHPSSSSNSVRVKTEPDDDDEVEIQSFESKSALIQSTRSNLEHLLNKSVQKYIRPKSEKEMYNLLSKCEKEEIQKIKSIRGGGDEKPNLFACHCGEGFLSKALLIEHKKVHITTRDCIFKCSICQAKFHTHRTYDQHLITHFGLNRRLCAFCGQSLASKIEFTKHIQTVHGGKSVMESPEKLSALLKEYGKSWDDGPQTVQSENDFEIEIDYDNPEPGDTLLPLQSEASTSQSSDQSQNDCLGIIDKIANRLKNFKPSASEPQDHFSSESDDFNDREKRKTKSAGKSKNRARARDSIDKDKSNVSNQLIASQDPAKCISAKRFKCTLDPFTDPRCFLSGTDAETSRNCLVIQIPKIDNVLSQLKESPTITINSEILHNISKSSQGPPIAIPEYTKTIIPLYKKKKKRPSRFGGPRRRNRITAPRNIKEEVFEYKVEPIPELHNLQHTKDTSLSLTEEAFGDNLPTVKTEKVKKEIDIDVAGKDQQKVEDWSVVIDADSDEDDPMISEGVDENNLVNEAEEDKEHYDSQQNQPLIVDFEDSVHSLSSNADSNTSEEVANCSQGDSGIVLSSRSITEDEFNSQDGENTTDNRPKPPALGSRLSITNIITNIDSTSIKIEPFDAHHLDHTGDKSRGEDINDTKIHFASTKMKIKEEPCDIEVDESSTEASETASEEPTVFEKVQDQELSVFFSQNDLDQKGRAPTTKVKTVSTDTSFQFQNVNLYDGDVDPMVVDDETKTIVDDLLVKLNTKKEKEAKITMGYFPAKPSGPTEYSCIECNEGFHHESMLEEHQKYHNKEQPFLCRICFSQFQEYTTYTGHLTQHVGKNTKICCMCGFRTSTCRTLTNHFNAHHKKEEVESWKSSTSPPKTSDTLTSLPEANKEATPCRFVPTDRFTCELCYLICVDSDSLKRHLVSDCNVVKDALRRNIRT